jgi:enoyl-CoA hydratase/carnithine racemase
MMQTARRVRITPLDIHENERGEIMEFPTLLYLKEDHVLVITLNRPPANSVNLATVIDIEKALDEAEKDKDVRVIVFTGAGEKGFSAGFDVTDAANAGVNWPWPAPSA